MSGPVPKRRTIEDGAILGFAIGTLALTGTFGLRTALAQPDYFAEGKQLLWLALHGVPELAIAWVLAFLALYFTREGAARAVLLGGSIVITVGKAALLMYLSRSDDVGPWAVSPATRALCAVVNAPLALSFLPVIAAVFAARPPPAPKVPIPGVDASPDRLAAPAEPPAHDRPLEVRAALSVWLGSVGFATIALGPDLVVRGLGLLALTGAALHFAAGRDEERRLFEWAQRAVTQGPPAFTVQEETPPDEVPSLYAGQSRRATIYAAGQQAASYRREPSKQPLAAFDPGALRQPPRFARRVTRRLAAPIVYTLLGIACSWPLLHSTEMPPRALTERFEHEPVSPYTGDYSIPGLTLWSVQRGPGNSYLVGYDPDTHQVVEADDVFSRTRGVSINRLAQLAHSQLYGGNGALLLESGADWPRDDEGGTPRPPHVENGKLVFWYRQGDKAYRCEVAVQEGMIGGSGPGLVR